MPSIIWSEASLGDIRSIEAYLGPRVAQAIARVLGRIRDTAALLERFPSAGAPLDDFRHLRVNSTPYVLVCRLAGSGVEVVRIRHGRDDWLRRLDPE